MRRWLVAVAAWSLLSTGCGSTAAPSAARTGGDWFTDVAHAAGVDVVHRNAASGKFYIAEIMGSGVGLFDYDNDGDLDLYVVQGGPLGGSSPAGDRLYRNDLSHQSDGRAILHFTDVTDAAGIHPEGYGMGVAAGDIDRDGDVDLLLTRLDRIITLRNEGNGTFSDVSTRSGIVNRAWAVSASLVDYDRDGSLDVYIGNYLAQPTAADARCFSNAGQQDYCAPASYRPLPDRLFRNRGDGTFIDVSARSGVGRATAPALGVVATDVNGDLWPDLFVANDATPNLLWINQRDGTFRDTALEAGVAVSGDGRSEGSMGIDAADIDDDGDEDLLVTNIAGEGHDVYVNDGGAFVDRSAAMGLTTATLPYTGFGVAWIDVDNDGRLDMLVANGGIHLPLPQHLQLLQSVGGRFTDVTARAGAVFSAPTVGRGAAFGDLDNDGDVDVVVANNNGPLQLLRNDVGSRHHWIGVALAGTGSPGAHVTATLADGSHRIRRSHTDGSYASASDPRLLFGLGDAAAPVRIDVVWADGRREQWRDVAVDRWVTLTRGSGQ